METFGEYFPNHMWEEIMSWLPPESLKRYKYNADDSWYDLIDSLMNNPAFVAKHHDNMETIRLSSRSANFKNLEAMDDNTKGEKVSLVTLVGCDLEDDPVERFCIPCLSENLKPLVHGMDRIVVCHCNGIICLYNYDDIHKKDNIFLINPALMELKMIQKDSDYPLHFRGCVAGFGYDSRTNDYKVVMLKYIGEDGNAPYKAEVYTLSTNSWKDIELNVDFFYLCSLEYNVVYCKGICYCRCWPEPNGILSFDVSDEVFRMIDLPHDEEDVPDKIWDRLPEFTKIAIWKESLVYFFYPQSLFYPTVIHMWVLDAGEGVQGPYSWTKHLTIGPLRGIAWPLAFWDDHQLFMRSIFHGIVLYNLHNQAFDEFRVPTETCDGRDLVIFTKSLVSVVKKEEDNN